MVRFFALLIFLSACGGIPPQKSRISTDLGMFETAFVETGRTNDGWTVAHIVRKDDQYALVAYVRRADGRKAAISSVRAASTDFQHVQIGTTGGVRILHAPGAMEEAAKFGFEATLCGSLGCYPVSVPATLYQQALFE